MKKLWIALFLCFLTVFTGGCAQKPDNHTAGQTTGQTAVNTAAASSAESSTDLNRTEESTGADLQESTSAASNPDQPSDDYPYDIAADRAKFDDSKMDIVVGDNLYMTQINDWYMNFQDYDGKSVEIEGYYMAFDKYTFVGRKGPTCPYCTGGYVNFEFQTDEDLSSFVSESTWVRITGILRQGTMYPGSGQASESFYYIEAMKIEKMDEVGMDTITN